MPQVINEVGDVLSVPVNVIDPATGNGDTVTDAFTGTTVHNEAGTDLGLSDPTVLDLGSGNYRLSWAGVTAHMVDGVRLFVMVRGTGTASGAWTPWNIEVYVRAVERGTDLVDTSGLATQVELDKVPKKDVQHTYTSATGTSDVTITET